MYTEEEERALLNENKSSRFLKHKQTYDNRILTICMMFAFFFMGMKLMAHESVCFECPACQTSLHLPPQTAASAQWRCSKCHRWIYSEISDWKGDFFCPRCGTKKGDD